MKPAMISKLRIAALITAALFVLASCETIELTVEGEKARVLSPDDVKNCQKNGAATVSVSEKYLGVVPKSSARVANQLRRLARNSATHMGGDTVVQMSKVDRGQQTFAVFRCIP